MAGLSPALEQQYLNAMIKFTDALNNSSFGAGGTTRSTTPSRAGYAGEPSTSASGADKGNLKLEKALQDSTKTAKEFMKIQKDSTTVFSRSLADYSDITGSMFKEAIQKLDVDKLDKFTEDVQGRLDKFGSHLGKEIKTIDDLIHQQEFFANKSRTLSKESYAKGKEVVKAYLKEHNTLDGVNDVLADLNLTADDLDKSFEELEEEIKVFNAAIGEAAQKAGVGSGGAGRALSKFSQGMMEGVAIMTAFLGAVDALAKPVRDAAKMGVDLNAQQMLDATRMGMTFEDLANLQGQYRTSIVSLGMSMEDYNDALNDNMSNLSESTASYKDAALISADLAEQHRLLGGNSSTLSGYMQDQSEMFTKMNKTISLTGEEFVELNKHLRNDTAIRGQMIRMTKERRRQYFAETQQLYEKLRLGGMTNDQAKQLISTLAELGGGGAKGRVQQAAKLEAVMGAAGMGAQGARAGALLRGGLRNPKEKAEFTEIMTKANEVMGKKMGGSLAQEMAFGQMIESTGLEKLLGPGSMFQDAVIQQGLAIEKGIAQDAERAARLEDWQVGIKNTADVIAATLQGEIARMMGQLVFLVGAIAGSSIFGGIAKLLGGSGLVGGAKAAAGAGMKFAGSAAGKVSGLAAGLVSGGLEVAENWDRQDLSIARKTAMAGVRGGSAGGGALAGAAAGAAIGSVVPVLGTAIGGLIGAALGAWGGDSLGQALTTWMDPKETRKDDTARYAQIQDQRKEVNKEQKRLHEQMVKLKDAGKEAQWKRDELNAMMGELLEVQRNLQAEEKDIPIEVRKVADILNKNENNEENREEARKAEREFNKAGSTDVIIRRQGAARA